MAQPEISILTKFVSRYRVKLLLGRIARTASIALLVLFGLLALLQAGFALFPWTALPLVFDIAFCGSVLFVIGSAVFIAVIRSPDLPGVAQMIEAGSKIKNPLLSIALELSVDPRSAQNLFTQEVYKSAMVGLARCPGAPELPKPVVRSAIIAVLVGAWCFLNPVFSPRLLDFWNLPFAAFARDQVSVEPGTMAIPINTRVTLRLKARDTRYPSCRLSIATPDGGGLSALLLRRD